MLKKVIILWRPIGGHFCVDAQGRDAHGHASESKERLYACSKNDFPFKYCIEKLFKYCRNDFQENDEFLPNQLRKEIQRKLQIAKKIDENSPPNTQHRHGAI